MRKSKDAVAAARDAALAALANAKPSTTFGDLLWWDFTPSFVGDAATVRGAWLNAGLDPNADLPNEANEGTAFSRAVHIVSTSARGKGCRVEDCAEQADGSRRVAILSLERTGTVRGETVGVVVLFQNGLVFVEQEDPTGLARAIERHTLSLVRKYNSSDVRQGVMSVLDRWAATPCRQAPPHIVYWLPSPGGDVIRRVRDAVAAMGAGKIHLTPMGRNDDAKEAASSAANDGLEARLAEFASQVKEWQTSPPGRATTIERRIADADALRKTAMLYRAILGSAVDDIDAKVDEIQQGMRGIVGLIAA